MKTKSVLASLTLRVFDPKRCDNSATLAAITNANADVNAGRFIKNIVKPEMLKPINQIMNAVRTYHYSVTLPWGATGLRKLPTVLLDDYFARMRIFRDLLAVEVDKFCSTYEANRDQEKIRLSGMFNLRDYPPASKVRESFEIYVDIPALPEDIVVSPSIRDELEAQGKRLAQEAQADVCQRIVDVLRPMVSRLSDSKAIFRDSLIDNVRSLVEILPALNISEDANIDAICEEIKAKLAPIDVDELRTNVVARMDAAETAKQTLAKLNSLFDLDEPATEE